MRELLVYILLLPLVIILQVSFFSRLPAGDYGPDLILVVVFSAGFFLDSARGSLLGFIAGMLQDVLLGGAFGIYTVSRAIVGAFAGRTTDKVFPENLPVIAGVIFIFSFAHEMLIFLLSEHVIFRVEILSALTGNFLPTALYTMMIGTLLYLLIFHFFSNGGLSSYEEEN